MLEGSIKDLKKIAASPSTPSHLLIELGKHQNSQIRSLANLAEAQRSVR